MAAVEAGARPGPPAKPLKRLKTAMGGYWKKLAWVWVGAASGLGLAPHRLGRAITGADPVHPTRRARKSRVISRAALWPGAPVTPPPGWVEAPHM
jgi:hypothetical protein